MNVQFTGEAAKELDVIIFDISEVSPQAAAGFRARLRAIIRKIGEWPRAAQIVSGRSGTRMVPMQQYPYNIFYRIIDDTVQIVHIRHGARDDLERD